MTKEVVLSLALTITVVAVTADTPVSGQASSRERQLYVSVLDQAGAPVRDLQASDFVVREDGVRREVLRARPATAPMQIAILVDTSEAATNVLRYIRPAVLAFVQRIHENNEIAIITFGDPPAIIVEATSDLQALEKGANRLFPRPSTGAYLLDALFDAAQGFERREASRPVILAIATEGIAFSNRGPERVMESITDSGAALHAIVLGPGDGASGDRAARDRSFVLSAATMATGGRRDNLRSGSSLRGKLLEAAAELSSQYLVEYVRPETLIPPEKIEVGVNDPQLVARGNPVRTRGAP